MQVIGRGWWMLVLGLVLLSLGCRDLVEAPAGLSYSENPAAYVVGTAIPANTPTHSGGAIDSYAVSPALPDGLSLNSTSGVITGTPTIAAATADYTVTATNATGSTTATLNLTVKDPAPAIAITAQPANQSISVGQTATFSVTATANTTLSYQWLKDGVAIAAATSASYTTPMAVLADDGSAFSVQVSDTLGNSLTSTTAILTVLTAAGPGTFLPTGDMSTARASATATLLPSGKVLIVGGFNGISLGSAELFEPSSDGNGGTFTPTAGSLAVPREYHTATLLANGKVLIAGGNSFNTVIASAELYDPATDTFTAAGNLGAARSDHTATLLPSGQVLIVSGRNLTVYLASAELYDPGTGTDTGTFTPTASAPAVGRATHTATLLWNGKVLIAGGYSGATNLTSAELYDPGTGTDTGTFTATASMAVPRAYHTATLLPNGEVLMVGGADTATTERYDPVTGTFSTAGNLTTVRVRFHAAALLPTGKVLIAGGIGTGSPAPLLSAAELYDPTNSTFTPTGSMTVGRQTHTATTLLNEHVLIAGGSGAGTLASAETYY